MFFLYINDKEGLTCNFDSSFFDYNHQTMRNETLVLKNKRNKLSLKHYF